MTFPLSHLMRGGKGTNYGHVHRDMLSVARTLFAVRRCLDRDRWTESGVLRRAERAVPSFPSTGHCRHFQTGSRQGSPESLGRTGAVTARAPLKNREEGGSDSGEKKKVSAMPGSPVDVKTHSRPAPSAMPPLPSVNPSGPRPATFSSTALTNGMNHSPPTLNAVPSPPQRYSNGPSSSSSSSLANQQLPATCGARQLSKLKRFLTTLQQFGNDISPEIGESVRNLVLALVNSTVTIEEFHSRLQEATNFPLRPFVIPFLKANLPLLQRELLHCARAAKQTPAQYLSQHEHLLLSTTAPSPPDSTELLLEPRDDKRHSPSRGKENGFHERPAASLEPPTKRICTISPAPRHSPAHPLPLANQIHPTPPPLQHYAIDDIATPHLYREPHRILELRELKDRPRLPGTNGGYREESVDHRLTEREWADEWRHLDHVLNCIVDMVEKTRRSVNVLRRCQEADREELNYWRRRLSEQEQDPRKAGPGAPTFSKTHSPHTAEGLSTETQRDFSNHPGSAYVSDEIWRKAGKDDMRVKCLLGYVVFLLALSPLGQCLYLILFHCMCHYSSSQSVQQLIVSTLAS
ncbi:hypothetical protein AALO_G00143990 [Alosa alosa]|uniref:TAFH domain-containing protein n=1 Tax=Alosa alosa TaxID=278164 RepID=A0AAV6GP35_9TELE|nr:hypothetical protein AALO_G00143990 [Alosa alosa]